MKYPKIAILTLNWNGHSHLKYFLKHASNLSYPNYFTVVIDNGSTDNSIEFVKENYPMVEIINNKVNIGYSKGFNRGIKFALGKNADYILITTNDVVLDKKILDNGIKVYHSQEGIGFMSGKVYELNTKKRFQYAGGRSNPNSSFMPSRGAGEIDIGQYEDIADFEFMDDVCCLVNSEMIKHIGPYDEDFFFDYEETEWNYRMREKKYRIVYNPNMKVWHRIHGSTKGSRYSRIPEYYHWKGKILFKYKTQKSGDYLFFLFSFLFKEIPIHWFILIKNRKTSLIFYNFKGIIAGIKRVLELKA